MSVTLIGVGVLMPPGPIARPMPVDQAVYLALNSSAPYGLYAKQSSVWGRVAGLTDVMGTATAAANNLTLPTDGNVVHLTGATQVNLLDSSDVAGGARYLLIFDSTPTVKHNQAASSAYKPILLAGSADLVAAVNTRLTVVYDSTNSVWLEVARTVA